MHLRTTLEQSRVVDYLFLTFYLDDNPFLLSVFYFGFSAFSKEYINAPEATTRDKTNAAIIASKLRFIPLPS
jgi:hypothetical protein